MEVLTEHGLLVEARRRLDDPKNWCPVGVGQPKEGHACLVATLSMIATEARRESGWSVSDPDPAQGVWAAAIAQLADVIGCPPSGPLVGHWNDAPSTTHDMVLAVLDEAVKRSAPEPVVEIEAPELELVGA